MQNNSYLLACFWSIDHGLLHGVKSTIYNKVTPKETPTLKSGTLVEAGRDVWAATCGEDRKFGLPHSQVNVQTNKTEAKPEGGLKQMPLYHISI
jgi:hypothetical protein